MMKHSLHFIRLLFLSLAFASIAGFAAAQQYGPNDDFDRDGIVNALDLDDDNDGVLDTQEMVLKTTCVDNYPNNAVTDIVASANYFPAGRELANTYDNNLGTFGGSRPGVTSMPGTVTYQYTVPLNDVTAFRFYSNGGGILNDGQVTLIGSVKFLDASGNVLYEQTNVIIPQASSVNPFVLTFPTPLQGVASFSLTDFSDASGRTGSAEVIWKDVNLQTCTTAWEDIDTDGDGVANRFDLDSDGDGCPDAQEASVTDSFTRVPFASAGVFNTGGVQPAVLSQINSSTFRDTNGNGFDDRLETVAAGEYAGIYTYQRAVTASDAVCVASLDTDGDGITDDIDIDDDNDGILDTVESGSLCSTRYPDNATTTIASSETAFPVGRVLENTYDNNLGTFGGAAAGSPELLGTVTYSYNTPLDNVTQFQFYSNGGSVLTDGQVTHIGSIKFYDSNNILLYQQDDLNIPQASTLSPYVLTLPVALNGVASFSLTDLSDRVRAGGEAIWREVNLVVCEPGLDIDTDGDGIVNRLDLDSDGDGCPDAREAAVVKDFPGVQFANMDVENNAGSAPALSSQVAAATFVDTNNNGFDDRFEAALDGVYTGSYTYANAVNDQIVSCPALPVTLISFSGRNSPEGIVLNWTTTDEKDFSGFVMERASSPKSGFSEIGSVKGGQSRYGFTDKRPLKGGAYYRLKMNDLDGSYAYSRIIYVYLPYGENEHTVFPNPSSDRKISIHKYFAIQSVNIYDVNGKPVGFDIVTLSDRYEFKLKGNASAGSYILEYRVKDSVIRRKFVIE